MTDGLTDALQPQISGMSEKQYERAQRTLKVVGTIDITEVVQAFMMLVEDHTKNRATLKVTPAGIEEHIFPKI